MKKKKPVQVDIKALQKLIKSVSHLSKSQKVKVRNLSAATLAVVLVVGVLATVPQIRNYFSSQPSSALEAGIYPGSGLGTGVPSSSDELLPWRPKGVETILAIPEQNSGYVRPRIYQNKVVYFKQSFTYQNFMGIYMSDVATGEQTTIDTQKALNPDIFGDYIVYMRYKSFNNNTSDVYLYNIITGVKENITNHVGWNSIWISDGPAIYDKNVVFSTEHISSNSSEIITDLKLYNIDTGVTKTLTTLPEGSRINNGIAIYDNKVVYSEHSDYAIPSIKLYDLDTDESLLISLSLLEQHDPDIYKNLVVWQEEVAGIMTGIRNIVLYNLTDNTRRIITGPNWSNNTRPVVYNSFIVWEHQNDTDPWDNDVYIRRQDWSSRLLINSAINQPLSTAEGNQELVDMFGNKVVWQDSRYDNPSTPGLEMGIHMYTITNM